MRKLFRQIHLWLSVPFGIIITLVCFSGAMLVFESEISEACRHDLYYVKEVKAKALPADLLVKKVSATLPDSVEVTGVSISSDPEKAWQVNLSKPRRASVYVDQYTGEIKGRAERMPFFMTMFRLHRWLMDSMTPGGEGIFWGKMIVGTSTLLFVFILISGIVIWFPRTVKAFKNSMKITARRGMPRFWHDLHVAGGMYVLLFLLVMSLTGLTWSFQWYREGFYKVFGVETKKNEGSGNDKKDGKKGDRKLAKGDKPEGMRKGERKGRPEGNGDDRRGKVDGKHGERRGERSDNPGEKQGSREGRSEEKQGVTFANWQKVYDKLKADNAGFSKITVSDGSATVAFDGLGNKRAADRYEFDASNGRITKATLYKDAEASGKMRGWIYSVHVGSFGGLFVRIIWFLSALIGATLPLTGYYLWIKRLLRKKKR